LSGTRISCAMSRHLSIHMRWGWIGTALVGLPDDQVDRREPDDMVGSAALSTYMRGWLR
jgi:hypothetical protein